MDPMNNLIPSALCIAWIKHSEGCKLEAYWDVNGYAIGYGHHGADVTKGTVWTQEQADAACESDAAETAKSVLAYVKVPLSQGQFDCLVDFTYQFGAGRLATSLLLTRLNMGNYAQVPSELYRVDPVTGEQKGWIVANGKLNNGLIARRKGDIVLWNGGNPLEGQ